MEPRATIGYSTEAFSDSLLVLHPLNFDTYLFPPSAKVGDEIRVTNAAMYPFQIERALVS
jgi:hypothetical protein